MVQWHPASAGARRHRQQTARVIAVLLAVLLLLTGWVARASAAPFSGTTQNGVNNLRADTLAAPTSMAVTQQCVADPTPVRRPGAGGSSFTSGNTSGNLTIARPSDAVAGDVLVAGMTWEGDHNTFTPSAPSGWTLVRRNGDNAVGQFVYSRVLTASEPSSYTWTGRSTNAAGAIVAFSGVDTTAPVNVHAGQVNSTNSQIIAPSITTTRANILLVGVFGIVSTQTLSAPAGMSAIWSGSSSGTGGSSVQVSTLGADEAWATPGATGSRTATATGGSRSIGQLIALQPPLRPFATSTWTTSSSTYATGQVFRRGSGSTVQRQATLSATVTSQTDGPLVSGTSYTVDVSATFASWNSLPAAVSFTGLAC